MINVLRGCCITKAHFALNLSDSSAQSVLYSGLHIPDKSWLGIVDLQINFLAAIEAGAGGGWDRPTFAI